MPNPLLYINIGSHRFPSFLFLGTIGYVVGAGLGITLTLLKGLNIWIIFLMAAVSAATFFALVWGVKWLKGEEDIVYYHHEIGILATCTFTLWVIGAPILAYLDIVLLGIGTLLAFGRWGCFSVGCCHGRPCSCKMAAVYTQDHAEAGFPWYYVGVKLFPLPLLESVWVFFTVGIGISLILSGFPAGTAIVAYTVIYGLPRFVFEFYRGDPERPYWGPFSEAQWTTLVLFLLTILLGWKGLLPYYSWHAWTGGLLVLFCGIYTIIYYAPFHAIQRLLNPRKVEEFAIKLNRIQEVSVTHETTAISIPIIKTSYGIQLSKGLIQTSEEQIIHYTISHIEAEQPGRFLPKIILNQKIVNRFAQLIQTLKHHQNSYSIKQGDNGVFHILFYPNLSKTPMKRQMMVISQ